MVSYADLVKTFFEVHDPTQGMRQGNDVGTQYRSAIYYTTPEQEQTARELTKIYGDELHRQRIGDITTEIRPASEITVLLRRGPPPAVPRQEPVRVPLPREHRRPSSPRPPDNYWEEGATWPLPPRGFDGGLVRCVRTADDAAA